MSEKPESKNENEKEKEKEKEIDTSKKDVSKGRLRGRISRRGNLSNTKRQVNPEENNKEPPNKENNDNNNNNIESGRRNFPMRRNYNNQRRRPINNYRRNYNYTNNNNYRRQRRGVFRRRNYFYNQINNYRRQRTYNFRKLFVSNLDSKITGHELNQIFSRIGKLTRCFINYDKLGTSLRSAFVDYENPRDARRAINQFDDTKIGRDFIRVTYKRVRRNNNNNFNRNYQRKNFNYNNNNNRGKRRMAFRKRRYL
jgi:RNA recognition motif-containing protein